MLFLYVELCGFRHCHGSDISYLYVGGIAARNLYTEKSGSVIEKCKATSNVYGKSKNSVAIVGGIVAESSSYVMYETYLIALSSVDDCGFIGEINTNAKTSLTGGIVGFNYFAKVSDNYSAVSFVNSFSEEGVTSTQTRGTIISQTKDFVIGGTESIVYGNHYVKTTDSDSSMNLIQTDFFGNAMLTPLTDEQSYSTAYDSLYDIPEEVRK